MQRQAWQFGLWLWFGQRVAMPQVQKRGWKRVQTQWLPKPPKPLKPRSRQRIFANSYPIR